MATVAGRTVATSTDAATTTAGETDEIVTSPTRSVDGIGGDVVDDDDDLVTDVVGDVAIGTPSPSAEPAARPVPSPG